MKRSSDSEGSFTTASASCHLVPSLLSTAFVGRGKELEWLRAKLGPENDILVGNRIGIYGMTGIGKTQLACPYHCRGLKRT